MLTDASDPPIIADVDTDHPFVGQRMLIILFAAGAIGEHLQTAIMPWEAVYEEPGREAEVAEHIEIVWRQLGKEWRFFGAIDSRTRRTVLTIATVGLLSINRELEDTPDPSAIDMATPGPEPRVPVPLDDDNPLSGTRVVVILFLSGAIGEHLQTAEIAWDDVYETPGREADLAEQIQTIWRQLGMEWRFFGAIDSDSGKTVLTMADIGMLAMNRAHAHDTTPLAQNLPDHPV